MTELKPCPFCGGEADSAILADVNGQINFMVGCNKCYISMTYWQKDMVTFEEATQIAHDLSEKWNRRVTNADSN